MRHALRRRYGRATGNYSGDPMPPWVRDGVSVKIKSTPITRKYGVAQGSGEKVWPGDVGVIRERQGNGWWDYDVVFDPNDPFQKIVRIVLDVDVLDKLSRVAKKRGAP